MLAADNPKFIPDKFKTASALCTTATVRVGLINGKRQPYAVHKFHPGPHIVAARARAAGLHYRPVASRLRRGLSLDEAVASGFPGEADQ
jgi:hypothetical protein